MHLFRSWAPKLIMSVALLAATVANGAAETITVLGLQSQWDITNFQLTGDAQYEAFEQLLVDADAFTAANPDVAEGWIWSGIIKSSFAGVKGGLGALGLAKKARIDLEQALEINADAMQGSAYNSLGTLYYKVPGWPLGFGDDEKAEELLLKALQINPDGIVSNYFYAEFLRDQKRYAEATRYYEKAQNAPLRPDRPIADAGRRKDIQAALASMRD